MKSDTRERFTLRMPRELLDKIQDKAETAGVSANALILEVLRQWKEDQKGGRSNGEVH